MAIPLLSTKSQIPNLPAEFISRPRLKEKLEKARGVRLILISAPPGFGKTSIAVDWLRGLQYPVAWLSLDKADSDPIRFFAYLAATLETIDPRLGAGTRARLGENPVPPVEALVASLINDISAFVQPVILALDDYHLLMIPATHQAMTLLIERQPANLKLVIITREDPPLPLPRLRAQRQMAEIREADLRFSLEESAEFMSRAMGVELSVQNTAALLERTEGWVAGLQMAGLALSSQGSGNSAARSEDFINAFRGDHRYIMDYLMDEVFQRQPRHIQEFLLNTSILDRLSAPLCDRLIQGMGDDFTPPGQAVYQGSQQILETLERQNLFLLPLDNRREWYRYHHLFADLLLYRLKHERPDRLSELHRRASSFFLLEGDPDEAMRHALETRDWSFDADTAEQILLQMTGSSRLEAYLEWLKQIPEEEIARRAYLCACCGWAYVLTYQIEPAEHYLQSGEQALASYQPIYSLPDSRWISAEEVSGHLTAIRSYADQRRGDFSSAVEHARQALDILPEDAIAVRCAVALNLALLYYESRALDSACQAAAEALSIAQESASSLYVATSALRVLGVVAMIRGKLNDAEDFLHRSLEYKSGRQVMPSSIPSAAFSQQWLVVLHYQRNEIEAAQACQNLASQTVETMGGSEHSIRTALYQGLLDQCRGDIPSAEAHLRQAEQGLQLFTNPGCLIQTESIAIRGGLYLAQDDALSAEKLLQSHGILASDLPAVEASDPIEPVGGEGGFSLPGEEACRRLAPRLPCYLLLARLLLAQGNPEQAAGLAERIYAIARTVPEFPALLEALALLASIPRRSPGDTGLRLAYLEQALNLAAPEGYVRPFLNAGWGLIKLLRQAIIQNIQPAFAQKLLAALEEKEQRKARQGLAIGRPESPAGTDAVTVEKLTGREQQILRLLAAGLSSTEIARELFLSVSTTRTYIKILYQKLGVHSRDEAVEKAQQIKGI